MSDVMRDSHRRYNGAEQAAAQFPHAAQVALRQTESGLGEMTKTTSGSSDPFRTPH